MSCSKCQAFVYDYLQNPPSNVLLLEKSFKYSRFIPIVPEITPIVVQILEKINHTEYRECDLLNPQRFIYANMNQLGGLASIVLYNKNVELFTIFLQRNSHLLTEISHIMILLMEHCILEKEKDVKKYMNWFAQRFMFLLEHFSVIHREHCHLQSFVDISVSPNSYIVVDDDELYT
jgi:hypothetical protein